MEEMGLFKTRRDVFCAFCKTPRKVYVRKSVGFVEWIGALTISISASFALYQGLDKRLLPLFVLVLLAAEVGVRIRRRMSLTCRTCGFDPMLYKKNPNMAATRVRQVLDARKEDPRTLFANPIHLPKTSPKEKKIPTPSPQEPEMTK